MQNNIMYDRINHNTECIYYMNSKQSYPVHTHANHVTFGCILDGAVCMICNGEKCYYRAGENFCILPDTPHAVKAVNDTPYSMMIICTSVDAMPQNVLRIKDMAQCIGVSPYHMIRKFKIICAGTQTKELENLKFS